MDANLVLWKELNERGIESLDQLNESEVVELALRYAVWYPLKPLRKHRGSHHTPYANDASEPTIEPLVINEIYGDFRMKMDISLTTIH